MTFVCFPLRIDWELATGYQPTVEPYPAPFVAAQERLHEEWPGPVASVYLRGQIEGWESAVTYAVGYLSHATLGTPGAEPKQSWAVRMRRKDQRAVAVRMGDKWASLWTWSGEQFFTRHKTLAGFMEALTYRTTDGR